MGIGWPSPPVAVSSRTRSVSESESSFGLPSSFAAPTFLKSIYQGSLGSLSSLTDSGGLKRWEGVLRQPPHPCLDPNAMTQRGWVGGTNWFWLGWQFWLTCCLSKPFNAQLFPLYQHIHKHFLVKIQIFFFGCQFCYCSRPLPVSLWSKKKKKRDADKSPLFLDLHVNVKLFFTAPPYLTCIYLFYSFPHDALETLSIILTNFTGVFFLFGTGFLHAVQPPPSCSCLPENVKKNNNPVLI